MSIDKIFNRKVIQNKKKSKVLKYPQRFADKAVKNDTQSLKRPSNAKKNSKRLEKKTFFLSPPVFPFTLNTPAIKIVQLMTLTN